MKNNPFTAIKKTFLTKLTCHKRTSESALPSLQNDNTLPFTGMILLVFFGILFWIGMTSSSVDASFDSEQASLISGDWTISYGTDSTDTAASTDSTDSTGETVCFSTTLNEEDGEGDALIFYTMLSHVRIYLDGELLLSSDENRETPFPMLPASAWYYTRLPQEWDGKELTICQTSPLADYSSSLPAVYIGTKAAFLYMILKQGLAAIIIGFPVIVLGFAFILISPLLQNRRASKRLLYLGLFAVSASSWTILESRITQLFTGNLTVASYLLFSCFFLMPVFILSFLSTFSSFEKNRFLQYLHLFSGILFISIQIFQILGIFNYMQMVPVIHVLVLLIIVCVLHNFFKLRKKEKQSGIREQAITALHKGLLIFGIFCAIDVFRFYIFPTNTAIRFSRIGLLIFIVYLGFTAVKQTNELQLAETRQRVYRELAFKDILTGLKNRTSFEHEMARFRGQEQLQNLILLVADLNNLKFINDNFGHSSGDHAIILTAHCLANAFRQNCSCFRIGGDEFCVISSGLTLEQFTEYFNQFLDMMKKEAAKSAYPLSVACGYQQVSGTGIDECLKAADACMYENKKRAKGQASQKR